MKRTNDETYNYFPTLCMDVMNYILEMVNEGTAYNRHTSRQLRLVDRLFYRCVVRMVDEFDEWGKVTTDLTSWSCLKRLHLKQIDITDPIFDSLTCLSELRLYNFCFDNDEDNNTRKRDTIAPFKTLKKLAISEPCNLRNEHFQQLVGLTFLSVDAAWRENEVMDQMTLLTNLETLVLCNGANVYDAQLIRLTQLTSLTLFENQDITQDSLICLTNLTRLNLSYCISVAHDTPLFKLTKLRKLNLNGNEMIQSAIVKQMTQLTSLKLACNYLIDDATLACLTNLTKLNLCCNYNMTQQTIRSLPLLKKLCIDWIGHPLLTLRDEPNKRFVIKEIDTQGY